MVRRCLKGLYACFVIALWCIAFVALMEGVAFVYQLRMERANPLIAAYRAGQPLPASDCFPEITPVKVLLPSAVGGWNTHPMPFKTDISLEQVLAWGPVHVGLDQETQLARRMSFAKLSTDAREMYARLGKEMVLVFNTKRRIHRVYGSDKFFFEDIQYLLFRAAIFHSGVVTSAYNALDAALKSGIPEHFQIYWPNPEAPAAILSAVCIPSTSEDIQNERAYMFVNLNPDEICVGPSGQLPETTRWIVPYYRFKANYSGAEYPGFQTNSLGFRDQERIVPKPEGVFRILCLGGSTTQEGDTNETTYPALLEAKLKAAFPDRVIEVVNAGIPGIATPLHLLRLSDYLDLQPDLVVLYLGINDVLLKYNTWITNCLSSRLRCSRMFFPSLTAPLLKAFVAYHREYMGINLQLMSLLFQQRGAAVAFVSVAWPHPETITGDERQYFNYQGQYTWEFPAFDLETYANYIRESNTVLKETAALVDGIYIPVGENLAGGTAVFVDFCHMTPKGIQAKTGIIFNGVKPLLERKFQKPDLNG